MMPQVGLVSVLHAATNAERLSPAVGLQRIPGKDAGVTFEDAAQSLPKPLLVHRASASGNIGTRS